MSGEMEGPHHGGACFFSAPTSPARAFNASPGGSVTASATSPSRIPARCESKPALPERQDVKSGRDGEDEFEFRITGQSQRTADELFYGGKIKPLKPPRPPNTLTDSLGSQSNTKNQMNALTDSLESQSNTKNQMNTLTDSLESQSNTTNQMNTLTDLLESQSNTKNQIELLYPRNKKYDSVDTEVYVLSPHGLQKAMRQEEKREKGREKTYDLIALSRKQRGTGSVSQFKVSKSRRKCSNPIPMPQNKAKESSSKRWNLRDLWVKKSDEKVLKKYSVMKKSTSGCGGGEDVEESSFGSTESGCGGGGGVRRRGAVSAHERHYTAKRAVAEERRRKTVLPYKHGLLGCMGFNFDPVVHDFSKGIGSLTRG